MLLRLTIANLLDYLYRTLIPISTMDSVFAMPVNFVVSVVCNLKNSSHAKIGNRYWPSIRGSGLAFLLLLPYGYMWSRIKFFSFLSGNFTVQGIRRV